MESAYNNEIHDRYGKPITATPAVKAITHIRIAMLIRNFLFEFPVFFGLTVLLIAESNGLNISEIYMKQTNNNKAKKRSYRKLTSSAIYNSSSMETTIKGNRRLQLAIEGLAPLSTADHFVPFIARLVITMSWLLLLLRLVKVTMATQF